MTKLTFTILLAFAFSVGWLTAAKAQYRGNGASWCDTVTIMDNGHMKMCTICYHNGGRSQTIQCM